MAQTQRTLAQLLANLPDNTAGLVDPVHIRDIVATIQPGHAELTVTTPAATVLSDTTTWTEVAGTWALSANNSSTWEQVGSTAELRYTGPQARVLHIAASLSFTVAGSNDVVELGIGLNGTLIPGSDIERKIGTGSDVGAAALHALVAVSTNDDVEILVRNVTAADNITLTTGNLFVMDMAM